MSYIGRLIWTHVIDHKATRDRYARIQSRRLERMLQLAQVYVPGQAKRLQGATVSNWTDIEPISKTQMMAKPGEFLNHRQLDRLGVDKLALASALEKGAELPAGWYRNKILVTKTSGTSGETGLVFNTRKTWAKQQAHLIGRIGEGILPLDYFIKYAPFRIAFIVLNNPLMVTNQIAQSGGKAGGFLTNIKTIRVDSNLHSLINEIEQFAPHLIMTYPNILEMIAEAKSKDLVRHDPLVLVSGSDYLSDRQARLVTEAFPESSFSNLYSTSECQPIASTCEQGQMHISTDCCLVEPVDAHGQPTPLGEFSDHVLLTGLLNDFQPFIRYRLNDEVRILTAPCQCGSPLPTMEIRGRSYPNIRVRRQDGSVVNINSREIRKLLIKHSAIKRFEVYCHQHVWDIQVFPDNHTLEGVKAFAQKYEADLTASLDKLKQKHQLADELTVNLHFKLLDPLSSEHLKQKMFTLIDQP